MTLRIDAHQHFWRYQPQEYGWISGEMARLKHDFLPSQLAAELAAQQIQGSVAVQARQTPEETRWLLSLAERSPEIKAVVGWIDLQQPDLSPQLEAFNGQPLLRGFRHLIQDEADPAEWMAQAAIKPAMQALQQQEYVWDLLVTHRHLAEAALFAARFDRHQIVLDHLGKPDLAAGAQQWAKQIAPLAALPHVSCKLSGLLTEPRPAGYGVNDLLPFVEAALEAFGSERIMVGSDWPVCLLAGEYQDAWQSVQQALSPLTLSEQAAITGGNACRIYRIEDGI
ncbi:amidohydrolase family protein [Erwinia pyri]|uniref:Amidohydrolase family protein n=1 Tax=Erwinia pyri TaxID=3062598 RepID=A0AA50DMX4_9GAMM|nr:amidohydrolase family protein [Erwinia sp. DE2]WLS79858.1 amidohydrolase family protein [Erwinia sp. DE2]